MSDLFIHQLKEAVYLANMKLVEAGLVVLTWGNASAVRPRARRRRYQAQRRRL